MSISDIISPVEGSIVPSSTIRESGYLQVNLGLDITEEQLFYSQFFHTNVTHAEHEIASKSGYQIHFPGKMRKGMDWMAIKRIIIEILREPKSLAQYPQIHNLQWNFDRDVKRHLNNIVLDEETIPVRSGLLKDTIMATMHVNRYQWRNTRVIHAVAYQTPPLYPEPIGGNVQHTMEEGVGPTYRPLVPIPNQHTIENYANGTSLYLMNDPAAQNDWIEFLNPKLRDFYLEAFAYFFTNLNIAIYTWLATS